MIDKEIEQILIDPNYDQSQLQDLFQQRFGSNWQFFWRQYMETGRVPAFYGDRS